MNPFSLKFSAKSTLLIITATVLLSLSSCSVMEDATYKRIKKNNPERYPAKVVMLDKKVYEGTVALPDAADKEIRIIGEQVGVNETVLKSDEVDYIEFWRPEAPERKHKFVKTKLWQFTSLKTRNRKILKTQPWIYQICESPTLKAFILAPRYSIDKNNDAILIGYAQSMPYGGSAQPSFSIFLQKTSEEYPTYVAVKGGIINEKSAFRKGVTFFLDDDPELCEYVNNNKLDTDDLKEIVKRYNPKK